MGRFFKKFGDKFTAAAHVTNKGKVKAFAGKASISLQREALRRVESELGLTPKWERYGKMDFKRNGHGVNLVLKRYYDERDYQGIDLSQNFPSDEEADHFQVAVKDFVNEYMMKKKAAKGKRK